MNVSPRGLRAFRSRPASRRQHMDMVVLAHIKEQSRLSLGSYGRPRMTEELKEIGVDVGHRRVGRLMRENGIVVERTRKFKATTDSDHTFNIAPNLLDRDFTADRPNQKCLSVNASIHLSVTGGRYQLHLDPRGVAVSGCDPGSAFPARHRPA
jgi:transposase InsO family protein